MQQVSPNLVQWLAHFNRMMKDMLNAGFKPSPINAREGLASLTFGLVTDRPQVSWIQDELVMAPPYNVPVRIYHPDYNNRLPVLIFFHGGGHMAGSVSVYDAIGRKLALATRHIVVSAEYRLAPECPYPAAVVDACNVVKNVGAALDSRGLTYDPGRVSIAGDSGGGSLCATVANLAQHDANLNIRCQVLIYPSLDYTLQWPSVEEYGVGYLLEKERILWYFDNYFQGGEDRKAASPLHMEFTAHLPETLVLTAGFCPLRDEGAAYVEKVKSTGVHAEHVRYDDMIHAFLNMENLVKETCESAYRRIGDFLNRTIR
jgi:acetyl esterase